MGKHCIILGLVTALLTLAIDQAVKRIMFFVVHITERPPIRVAEFLDLVMVWNRGISFGMFSGAYQPIIFIAVSGSIMIVLFLWLARATSFYTAFALGNIIGGAAGNVIDRLRFGAVADFFDFHLGIYHWPAFNIADTTIFIGVVLLCTGSMFSKSPKHQEDIHT